jgi:hypothetical protein
MVHYNFTSVKLYLYTVACNETNIRATLCELVYMFTRRNKSTVQTPSPSSETFQFRRLVDVDVLVGGMGGGGVGDRLPLLLVGARSSFSNKTALPHKTKVVSLLIKVNMNNMAPVYILVKNRMSATIAAPVVVVDDVPEYRRIDRGMVEEDERGHQPFDVPQRTKRIRKVERT